MKTKQLLFTLALLLMALPMWAEKFSPEAEILYRTNGDNSAWNQGFPKVASEANNEFEMKYYAGFYALQKYTITNLSAVTTLTLNIAGPSNRGTDAIAIWAFSDNDWTNNPTASDLTSKVTAIVGIAPHATEGDASTSYLLNTCGQNRETVDGVQFCHFVIQGDALSRLKEAATDNTFTLLITNRTQDLTADAQRKYYSSGHTTEAYRPYIEATFSPAVVQQEVDGVTTFTYCGTLNSAFDAIASSGTITLYDNIAITSRCNINNKTITVVPAADNIVVSSSLNGSILILGNNGNLTIGSDDHQLTIDGGSVTNSSNHVEGSGGKTTFNNVLFRNCMTSDNKGVVCHKSGGELHLNNVSFDDCTTAAGSGIVFAGSTGLFLEGKLTFTNCNEYNIYQEKGRYLRVGDISDDQAAVLTLFNKEPTYGQIILSSATGGDKSSLFQLMNEGYGIIKDPGHHTDHKITEAYTMAMNAFGASTLILPFESKIPEGVSAYTLNYKAGASNVVATSVEGTLAANTPVLINAEAGAKYSFVNREIVSEATAGSGSHTTGALTGVYEKTAVPEGSYILWANESNPIGFYLSNKSTVGANRAYLTAEGAGVKGLMIDFSGETTGIETMTSNETENTDAVIFNISGQRLNKLQRGINIINGKKVLVK